MTSDLVSTKVRFAVWLASSKEAPKPDSTVAVAMYDNVNDNWLGAVQIPLGELLTALGGVKPPELIIGEGKFRPSSIEAIAKPKRRVRLEEKNGILTPELFYAEFIADAHAKGWQVDYCYQDYGDQSIIEVSTYDMAAERPVFATPTNLPQEIEPPVVAAGDSVTI